MTSIYKVLLYSLLRNTSALPVLLFYSFFVYSFNSHCSLNSICCGRFKRNCFYTIKYCWKLEMKFECIHSSCMQSYFVLCQIACFNFFLVYERSIIYFLHWNTHLFHSTGFYFKPRFKSKFNFFRLREWIQHLLYYRMHNS